MHGKPTDRVLITRASAEASTRGQRVYITGPHFSKSPDGVYSSTQDRAKASTYTRVMAENLLAKGKWRSNLPEIEDA
jgi:hypothetical protein